MILKNSILLLFILFVVIACGISYSMGTDVKVKKKTINGVEYTLLNQTKTVNKRIGLIGDLKLENIIDFTGMDTPIHKTISKSDFDKQVDLINAEIFIVDSLSFTVSENKDRINLCYYLNLGYEKKQAIFTLEKRGGNWKLN